MKIAKDQPTQSRVDWLFSDYSFLFSLMKMRSISADVHSYIKFEQSEERNNASKTSESESWVIEISIGWIQPTNRKYSLAWSRTEYAFDGLKILFVYLSVFFFLFMSMATCKYSFNALVRWLNELFESKLLVFFLQASSIVISCSRFNCQSKKCSADKNRTIRNSTTDQSPQRECQCKGDVCYPPLMKLVF